MVSVLIFPFRISVQPSTSSSLLVSFRVSSHSPYPSPNVLEVFSFWWEYRTKNVHERIRFTAAPPPPKTIYKKLLCPCGGVFTGRSGTNTFRDIGARFVLSVGRDYYWNRGPRAVLLGSEPSPVRCSCKKSTGNGDVGS